MCPVRSFNPEYKKYFNERLAYGIRVLKGECGVSQPFSSAISQTLDIRDEMRAQGAEWQATRLTEWIRKAIAKGGFIPYAR
ncbi:hypothetical protein KAR91_44300 [Candidatus Pacearchaeota archaeon]|nr:hypothetical protein [Candidatus Pacearchaeota archaeon]